MPALRKELVDVQAADGLQQKIDVRRLPIGKSAQAINLVKNKQGRLEKRLGLFPLPKVDPRGSTFSINAGVALAAWNSEQGDNPLIIGRGQWFNGTFTTLQSYSDDLGGPTLAGLMPDLNITVDKTLAGSQGNVANVQSALSGNYLVTTWLDPVPTGGVQTQPLSGNLFWSCLDVNTGVTVVGPTQINASNQLVVYHRVTAINGTFVLAWSESTVPGAIYCNTVAASAIASGSGFSAAVTLTTLNLASNSAFDMRQADGDTVNFLLAYTDTMTVVVEQHAVSAPGPVVATWAVGAGSSANTAFGIRASKTANHVALCWSVSGSGYVIKVIGGSYTSFGTTTDTAVTLYTSVDTSEIPPYFIDVSFVAIQFSAHPQYVESHSPGGSCWNAAFIYNGGIGDYDLGLSQTAPNRLTRYTDAVHSTTLLYPSNNARIIQNLFYLQGVGAVQLVPAASGGTGTTTSNAIITPGLTLASRGCEANGKVYYLGWIPSITQGGFLALAFDQACFQINSPTSGNGYPMRPVGNVQTRSCLADPGYGLQTNPRPPPGGTGSTQLSVGPNCWTGASEWWLGTDAYATAYTAYASSSTGQRLAPAYGAFQTQPVTGYPFAEWGQLTAFGGALPSNYAGQNLSEQNYLYAPESILAIAVNTTLSGWGISWAVGTSYTWIFTWEYFDEAGNFHISARSTPVTVSDADLSQQGYSIPFNNKSVIFTVPSLLTNKMNPVAMGPDDLRSFMPQPAGPVTLGVYRTGRSDGPFAQTFFRVTDMGFNGVTPTVAGLSSASAVFPPVTDNTFVSTYTGSVATDFVATVIFQDTVPDIEVTTGALSNQAHPLLYGDGTNGSPGSLDNFCPPATPVMVRHKERLFVVRGNLVMFTKSRGELSGPGYNEQVNALFVGGDDDITGFETMDDKFVMLKQQQVFYSSGDGPSDDGGGSSFTPPQPIPTDVGCVDPRGVKSTPEGVYYMSTAGLRRISRGLVVEYVGGPVEDELDTYPIVCGSILYPQANRILFLAAASDSPASGEIPGELIVRDYVLDAWTTAVIMDGVVQTGFLSAVVANGRGSGSLISRGNVAPRLHLLANDGTVWREHDPGDSTPYYDNSTYVSSTWATPMVKREDAARFRLWDIMFLGQSMDPHGLILSVATDYGSFNEVYTWVWNSPGNPSIAPSGATATPLTQLDAYFGPMGEAFQVMIQDVADTASITGQGVQMLGCTLATGVYYGPYKVPPSAKQ